MNELRLDRNRISEFPERIFNNLRKIKTIYFNNNRIQTLHRQLFSDNLELEVVHAYCNPFKTINVDFSTIPNL